MFVDEVIWAHYNRCLLNMLDLVYTLNFIVSSSTFYIEKSSDIHIKKVIVLLVAEPYPHNSHNVWWSHIVFIIKNEDKITELRIQVIDIGCEMQSKVNCFSIFNSVVEFCGVFVMKKLK